jgi:RecJ-like exonuclease
MTVQSVPETLDCETDELRPKRGLVAGAYEGALAEFLEHINRTRLECSVRFVEREASTAPFYVIDQAGQQA